MASSIPADLRVINLLRRCIQGATEPWIHHANVYGGDPVSLTAAYPRTTAEDGDTAWYFLCSPQRKEGSAVRMCRKAGAGTWKGERTSPLYALKEDGSRVQVGFKETFSYILKKKTATEPEVRLGWIMHSFRLMDGEDSQGRCMSRVFPTPRRSNAPLLAVLAPVPLMASAAASPMSAAGTTSIAPASVDSAAAATEILSASVDSAAAATSEASATAAAATSEASATAAATSEALARPPSSTPFATAALPIAAAAAAITTVEPASAASATTSTTTTDSAAAATTDSATPASPPKKWVQIQISDSPKKSSDQGSAKHVYQMMLPSDQAEVHAAPSSKKMRRIECKGWLTLEPLCTSNIQIV